MKTAILLLFATTILASPIINKRFYDFDNDNIPDWCKVDPTTNEVSCLERYASNSGSLVWTTFLPSTSTSTTDPTSTILSTTSQTSYTTIPASTSLSDGNAVIIKAPAKTTSASASKASASNVPTAPLPLAKNFKVENGTKWHVTDVGTIFSSTVPKMGWDNGRTSVLGGRLIWNFGDVQSLDGLENGFSTGPAFYGNPNNMLEVDMANVTNVSNLLFAPPPDTDPKPRGATPFWGLSTGNVAEVSPGVGVGFVWEIWRNTETPKGDNNRGLGMYKATLGDDLPIGERTGPLVKGPEYIPVGIMTIMAAEGYVYTYTNGGPSGIIVGRALLADAFDIEAYEFLKMDGKTWVKGVPLQTDTSYGVQGGPGAGVGDGSGEIIHSDGQGSVFFSNYFNKYLLFTGAYASAMLFYVSDTPYGPWTAQYAVVDIPGYGINVHPSFSPGGSHKTIYVSSGAGNIIHMYKIEFEY